MKESNGLRERKKQATRRRIEQAALDLFSRRGFDNTTVEEVASAAEIAPRTFFHYFPTKEDVVLADYAGRLERIITELGGRPDAERPWAALRASFLVVAADFDAEREHLALRFEVMAASPSVYARSLALQAGWEAAVASTLADRMKCEPTDLGAQLLASAALGAIRSAQRHWLATGRRSDLPSHVEACFDLLSSGLGGVE